MSRQWTTSFPFGWQPKPAVVIAQAPAYFQTINASISGRYAPYDALNKQMAAYYDWLLSASNSLRIVVPEYYKHLADPQTDTIATLENFILAGLARVPLTDGSAILRLALNSIWEGSAKMHSFVHPDLRPYIYRQAPLWPLPPKPRYTTTIGEEEKKMVDVLERLRKQLNERALAELPGLNSLLPSPAVAEEDRFVFGVQDSALMSLLTRLRVKYGVVANTASTHLAELVNQLTGWPKRTQLLSPDLIQYLAQHKFPSQPAKALVPYSNYGAYSGSFGAPPIYVSNQMPFVSNQMPFVAEVPEGTTVWPATSVNPSSFVPVGYTYPSSFSSSGKPVAMPRVALVEGDQATLLGGKGTKQASLLGGRGRVYGEAELSDEPWIGEVPEGTVVLPAAAVNPKSFIPVGHVYQSNDGRPMLMPRVALIQDNQATLLGGKSEKRSAGGVENPALDDWRPPRLPGFDEGFNLAKKKTGGCTP